ncbi:MAG: TetR/AcrR family transcriptional regulator [Spirochaetia bacterium]
MARTRDKEKPSQIIEAAFAVFGDVGYEATVIKDIAEKAGISAGTIYTYFTDKRDLFRATAQEGWNRFLQQIREIAESAQPADARVRLVIDIGFRNLKDSLPLLRGMLFESTQMRILQHSLLELCRLLDRLLAEQPMSAPHLTVDPAQQRFLIRVTVLGVLFSAALAEPAQVDQEIDLLKATIVRMVAGG